MIREADGMDLLDKWGVGTPRRVLVGPGASLETEVPSAPWLENSRLVVKAHEAVGSRLKRGLVRLDLSFDEARDAVVEMRAREEALRAGDILVAEMVPHVDEYYMALQPHHEGIDLSVSMRGGVDVEDDWEHHMCRLRLGHGGRPHRNHLRVFLQDSAFPDADIEALATFIGRVHACYENEDATYIEINPVVIGPDGEATALDAVLHLDRAATFRHPDWTFDFVDGLGRPPTHAERAIAEADARIAGSVKLIELGEGEFGLVCAGGGASLFYADAVVAGGGRLANYAEYSGDPPRDAVEELTYRVSCLPGVRHLILGGAIANFTDVADTLSGAVAGLRRARKAGMLADTTIWVRRGGPHEQQGLALMRNLRSEGFDVEVYDRTSHLTEIVDLALARHGAGVGAGVMRE